MQWQYDTGWHLIAVVFSATFLCPTAKLVLRTAYLVAHSSVARQHAYFYLPRV